MPRITVRPLPGVSNEEEAKRALALVEAFLRTFTGEDENPSPAFAAMAALPGTDADGWELAQDATLLAADILAAVADNIGNPAGLFTDLLLVAVAAVPELKDDIDALKP